MYIYMCVCVCVCVCVYIYIYTHTHAIHYIGCPRQEADSRELTLLRIPSLGQVLWFKCGRK